MTSPVPDIRAAELAVIDEVRRYLEFPCAMARQTLGMTLAGLDAARASSAKEGKANSLFSDEQLACIESCVTAASHRHLSEYHTERAEAEIRADYHDEIVRLEKKIEEVGSRLTDIHAQRDWHRQDAEDWEKIAAKMEAERDAALESNRAPTTAADPFRCVLCGGDHKTDAHEASNARSSAIPAQETADGIADHYYDGAHGMVRFSRASFVSILDGFGSSAAASARESAIRECADWYVRTGWMWQENWRVADEMRRALLSPSAPAAGGEERKK